MVMWEDPFLLPYAVRFYRERLGMAGLRITVYDNESKDGSVDLAKALGCRVVEFATDGELQDETYVEVKSNCWKESEADWVIIVDLDEWLEIRPIDLDVYEAAGVSIVKALGTSLVWKNDTTDLNDTPYKVNHPDPGYDKACLFDRRQVTAYHVGIGAHTLENSAGQVHWLHDADPPLPPPLLYHVKYFSQEYLLERHRKYNARLSKVNQEKGWGVHYVDESRKHIPQRFIDERENAVPVPNLKGSSLFRRGEGGSPI